MNTFVIKSPNNKITGKFVGMSKDMQYVFIFRSNQVFKEHNPKVKDYTIVKDLCEEFDFKSYNVCPLCGGLGCFYEVPVDKKGKVKMDEDECCMFGEKVVVNCTCENGTYIGHLKSELEAVKHSKGVLLESYEELRQWIMKTSTCKTCKGDQRNTLGLCVCQECGLPGTGVWPG